MATYKKRDLDDVPDQGRGNDRKKPEDMADLYALPDGKYARLRFLPGVVSYGGHWVKTKKKDGKNGSFYVQCAAWSTDDGMRKPSDGVGKCAYCEQEAREVAQDVDQEKRTSRFTTDHFMNAIVRSKQKAAPEERPKLLKEELASGVKVKDSDSWTPVYAVRLTGSLIRQLKELKQLNVHENDDGDSKAFPVSHPQYGRDVMVMKDKSKPAAQMYSAQLSDPSPLTSKELKYLIQPIDDLQDPIDEATVRAEFNRWATKMGIAAPKGKGKAKPVDDDEDEDLDEEDDEPPAKSKKPAAKAKAKPVEEDEDLDEEDDEPPAKSKKPAGKSKRPADEEDEDLDEDDEPPAKSKKPAAKSKKPVDDDEDLDEDDDEPPAKTKPKSKAKPVQYDEEDDDEDDEPPAKSKKPAAKSKAKPVDDDEEDDDEDDEPPAKSKKPVAKKPAGKSKRPADDYEDDDLD